MDALILYGLIAGCGWFVNLAKSVVLPVQVATFLGMTVDLKTTKFRVPVKRLQLIRRQMGRALKNPAAIAPKEMASIARRIGSTKMAMPVAPQLWWDLYKAVKATVGRQELVRTP